MNHLNAAIQLATNAHTGQIDKSGAPFILHPLRVGTACFHDAQGHARIDPISAAVVGFLHDVVEDTDITLKDLTLLGYSESVISAVGALTRAQGETYFSGYLLRVSTNALAVFVKMRDLEDNCLTWRNYPGGESCVKRHEKAICYLEPFE